MKLWLSITTCLVDWQCIKPQSGESRPQTLLQIMSVFVIEFPLLLRLLMWTSMGTFRLFQTFLKALQSLWFFGSMNEFPWYINLHVRRPGPELECKKTMKKTEVLTCKFEVRFLKNSKPESAWDSTWTEYSGLSYISSEMVFLRSW